MDIVKYPSVYAAVEAAERSNWRQNCHSVFTRGYEVDRAADVWRAGPSRQQIASVEKLMSKIDASFRDREQTAWMPSPFGAFPIVPDYLAGDPFSMRHRQAVESDTAPMTFWIEAGLSFAYDDSQAARRAAAISALIARTAEMRPVEVKIICASTIDEYTTKLIQIDANMKTFDATYAARALVMAEIIRPLRWALIADGHYVKGKIGFAFHHHKWPNFARREQRIREAFGCAPQDVVIQAAIKSMPETERVMDNPVAWVHQQIEKQRGVE